MADYNSLRELCRASSNISETVIERFLLQYGASKDKLDTKFRERIFPFRQMQKKLPSNWIGLAEAQFIAHQIFKQQGLIAKYLNHASIKELDIVQRDYLRKMASHPWRFSFSEIRASPEKDFYEMLDIFSGETFLLYSPSVSHILSERPVLVWFNLIGFNSGCWQSFGPVTGFQCFDADDIFFYATELSDGIESASDLLENLEVNPVPYMMLMTGSVYPLVQNDGFEILQVVGEGHSIVFDLEAMKKDFRIEHAEGVFKLSDQAWSEFPHFSQAFYHEESGTLLLSAFTDRGYLEMAKKLNAHKLNLPVDPDIRLHLPMLNVIEDLLKKKPQINPYSHLFDTGSSSRESPGLDKLNKFLSRALPYINAGQEPDIDALAKEAGVDPESARNLLQIAMKKFREFGR